jgi:hypothetical protein
MAGRPDKLAELTVGHRIGIDKEAVDPHTVLWSLFRVMGIGAIRNTPPSIHTMSRYKIAARVE